MEGIPLSRSWYIARRLAGLYCDSGSDRLPDWGEDIPLGHSTNPWRSFQSLGKLVPAEIMPFAMLQCTKYYCD